jgi:hypothetical protein
VIQDPFKALNQNSGAARRTNEQKRIVMSAGIATQAKRDSRCDSAGK